MVEVPTKESYEVLWGPIAGLPDQEVEWLEMFPEWNDTLAESQRKDKNGPGQEVQVGVKSI